MSEKQMTGKDIIKRILPVVIALVLIVGIALTVMSINSCSNKTPKISKSDDVYLTVGDFEITNERLYTYLKQTDSYGVSELLRLVDLELYKEEMEKVDPVALDKFVADNIFGKDGFSTEEGVDGPIKREQNKEAWETLVDSLLMNNLVKKDQVDYDPYNTKSATWDVVRSYYKLQYARREWAKAAYVEELRKERESNDAEGLFNEEDIEEYFEANFSETVNAIIIPFTSEAAALSAMHEAGINTTASMLDSKVATKGWVKSSFNYNVNEKVSDDAYLTHKEVFEKFVQMYNKVYGGQGTTISSTLYKAVTDSSKTLESAIVALKEAVNEYIDNVTFDIVLPTEVKVNNYAKNATIEWSVEEGATNLTLTGNTLTYTSPEEETEIKVTAKVTLEENQTQNVEFKFVVSHSDTKDETVTITPEDAEVVEVYQFDVENEDNKKFVEEHLQWDIKSLNEVHATLAKKVIYINAEDSEDALVVSNDITKYNESYTIKPISCGNYYFLALKVNSFVGPNMTDVKDEIEAGLIEELFADNDNNIDDMIYKHRQDANLEIFDRYLEAIYDYNYTYFYETTLKRTDYDKYEDSKKKEDNIVARFEANGKTVEITADQLFAELKSKYAVSVSIDLINEYRVVNSEFNKIYNPYKDIKDEELFDELLESEVGNFRKNFEAGYFTYSYLSYYGFIPNFPASYGWKNFQKDYFGAFTDEELLINGNFGGSIYSEALTKFQESLYTDVDSEAAENSEVYAAMKKAYDEWYGINGINLIVGIDTNYDGSFEMQSDKDEETNEFTTTDWTAEQKAAAKDLIALISGAGSYKIDLLSQTGKATTYAQLEELVKLYNEASYVEETSPATSDDTVYTYNYFASYKQLGLVLKLEKTTDYLSTASLVEEFLDGIKVLYNKAKADNQEDTFSTPYASEPIETAYGFHLVYALGFAAQTELPTVEELTIYNLLQDAATYKDATVDYKVEIYENTVKTLKEKYDIVYYDEETQTTYEMDKEVTAKIDAWYTANLQEVANKAFTKDLINAIETLEIKVPSEQAEFDRIKAEIVRVSKKDLEAEDNK